MQTATVQTPILSTRKISAAQMTVGIVAVCMNAAVDVSVRRSVCM